MFRIKKLIPFILCVIMLIPLYGCSEAQQTAIESASLPDLSQYSKPKFDTEPPVPEGSYSEIFESRIEYNNMPETIDGLLAHRYSFDKNSRIKYESCLGEANCLKMYPDSTPTMHTDSDSVYAKVYEERTGTVKYNSELPEHILVYEGDYEEYARINDSFYIYTGNEIVLIPIETSQSDVKLIYKSTGYISSIYYTPNLIYIIEDDILKVMLPDGSDIREIMYLGRTVNFKPMSTTKIKFVRVYYGDYQLSQQDANTVYEYYINKCEEFNNNEQYDKIELFEDELERMFYWEYYVVDLTDCRIREVNATEYHEWC